MALFYGWGSTASRLEPLRGGSLLFTIKFLEISGTHFIDLGKMKGWVDLGATQLFWTRDLWIGKSSVLTTRPFVKESKNRLIRSLRNCFLFFFFPIQNTKNTGVCLYFERVKINYVFVFLFKMFLEIFKNMRSGSVSLYFEWTKEKADRKTILLPPRRASC